MLALPSQAWKSWKSAKAVALLVVVAFTVGIGSTTAIYTVINSLLLRPLPYPHGERFVSLLGADPREPERMSSLAWDDVLEYHRSLRSFDLLGWMQFANFNLTAPGQPQYVNGVRVTPELANGTGVNPRLGRWFQGASGELVISHSLWLRLGGNTAILGQPVTMDGRIYSVAGVMPPGFQLPLAGAYSEAQVDVWVPLDPSGRGENRDAANFGYARLRPGVKLTEAAAEARSVAAMIAKRTPDSHPSYTARVDSLHQLVTRDIKPLLLLLFAGAELLLLITCANAGGLMLARSVARARETAVRVALGAGLRQLALGYFCEGALVAIPGAVGGLLLAGALVRVLVTWASRGIARLDAVSLDWRVAVFAFASALAAGGLAGLAPLWQAARTQPHDVLSDGVRASASRRSRRLSRWFVVAEISLAFVLLAASAVLTTELYRVTRVWPGFDTGNLLTFRMAFAKEDLPGKATRAAYLDRLVEAVQAIPGVTGAALVNQLPLDGCCLTTTIYPEDKAARPGTGEMVSMMVVNPGYWQTLKIPLRAGRFLSAHDTDEKLLFAVINQATVRRYWPNQNPVGAYGRFSNSKGNRFQVVGVVGDVRNNGLDNPTVPEIYLSAAVVPSNPLNFAVRSPLPAATLVPEVRRAIRLVNPAQPIHEVRTMTQVAEDSLALKRSASQLMAFFAAAALLLATIGTYGMVSYSVRQRTVEMGTRLALGAVSRDLLRLVVGSGLKMAAYGVAIGGVASVGVLWVLVRALEVRNLGVLPFVLSAAVVACVAMAASLLPAWRATLLSPVAAIRNEPGSMWESAREGIGRFFEGIGGAQDGASPLAAALPAELIGASRGAASFREAIAAALEVVRGGAGAQSAVLLENNTGEEYRATAASPGGDVRALSIPGQGLLLGRLRSYAAPLPIGAADLEVWRRWALEYKPQAVAEIEMLEAAGARIAVPLRTGNDLPGVLLLGAPVGREEFTTAEKQMLRSVAGQFALLLENARLTDRVLEQEKLRRDVALAAEVQRGLLPRQDLETPAAFLTGVNLSARTIGGDYFDFFDLGDDRTAIALADVAGKGVPAALIMSVVQASLRVISAEPGITLQQLAARMNHFVYRSTGPSSYATFFYAELCQRTRRLRYVNAGQNPPYLVRAGAGAVEELPAGGTVIGLFPQENWEAGALDLHSGDVLVVSTDGVTDALNPADEDFGEDRLKALLPRIAHLPVGEMSAHLLAELKGWIQDAAQYDDLTFVVMKIK